MRFLFSESFWGPAAMGWIFLVGSYWGLYGRFHDDDGWSTTLIVGSLAYFVVAAIFVALMIRIREHRMRREEAKREEKQAGGRR